QKRGGQLFMHLRKRRRKRRRRGVRDGRGQLASAQLDTAPQRG
ncbi:transposase, partial [Xanthomonas oryzae pv. oryzae]